MKRLMVIIPDPLTALIEKGEMTDRYYNPGDIFDEVHIVMTNTDSPDPGKVQKTVGRARLHIHNFPIPKGRFFHRTLGWRPLLMRRWASEGVRLARRIKPDMIRCHGVHFNAFVASEIKRVIGIPYAVSVHINPDVDIRGRAGGLKQTILLKATHAVEKVAIRNADVMLPVYRPIVPYLLRMGAPRIEVVYNVLNPENLVVKQDYTLQAPPRVISVGRLIEEKYPMNAIEAARNSGAHITVVGDGPAAPALKAECREKGCSDSVTFIPALPNDQLCRMLHEFDIFATHSEYYELSKAVREALVCGLPTVLNRRKGNQVPELENSDFCLMVENTVEGYRKALEELVSDPARRERIGKAAASHSLAHWDPSGMEQRYAEIYKDILSAGRIDHV